MQVLRRLLSACVFGMVMAACSGWAQHPFDVLVFSKTRGFRHPSIPEGIAMVQRLGEANGFGVETTEESTDFNDTTLSNYAAIVFMSTTGDILDPDQQAAFQRYIRNGGGFVGVHATSDTERTWPWFGELIGAYFRSHPSIQQATTIVADRSHPSTQMLPERWVRTDEWYNYTRNPRGKVHVLATLDESSYGGGSMGYDHPIAWCHNFDGGRVWYTGGGHSRTSYTEPLFEQHVLGGILWAAGVQYGDAGATVDLSFDPVILDSDLRYAMQMEVTGDGRVLYIERTGCLKIWKPSTQATTVAATFAVSTEHEDGLTGLAVDPGFSSNHWVYVMYSPENSNERRLSRFTLLEDQLDPTSERVLLTIPGADECCHAGGNLEFGPDGTLYIPMGDNTDPFQSNGYSPIDERPGRETWDAQRTAANANDLRGKILRIRPEPDGTYSIPDGNLFPLGATNTRPEIYVMGCRNPFRVTVDEKTGWLYWGDVGPDAWGDSPTQGPKGYDEVNQTREAGYYGWPYFIADNKPYQDFDFTTEMSSGPFYAAMPENDSPNNTGPLHLPIPQPAWIWYPYGDSIEFPVMNQGSKTTTRSVMAGPVFHMNPAHAAEALPPYYDNSLLVFDRTRRLIVVVKLDEEGDVLITHPFLLSRTLEDELLNVIDLAVGPEGRLYALAYAEGNLEGIHLIRLDYLVGNSAPLAVASASPDNGGVPLDVQFSSLGSRDSDDGDSIHTVWSFFGDGATNSTDPNPSYTYTAPGRYTPQLRVYDQAGKVGVANLEVVVGNHRPEVRIAWPPHGGVYDWGEALAFSGTVTDVEDGRSPGGGIECDEIFWELALGHNDDHEHGLVQFRGCEGVLDTPFGHGQDGDHVFLTLLASYDDHGSNGVPRLSDEMQVVLQPRRKQAEHDSGASGVSTLPTRDTNGQSDVVGIDHGDWIRFAPLNFTNIEAITLRVSEVSSGSLVEFHLDAPDGPTLTTAVLPSIGSLYTNVTVSIADPGGTHEVFLVFVNEQDPTGLCRLNWLEFQGPGITIDQPPYQGQMAVIPGVVEVEQFDEGGAGVSFYDSSPGNLGRTFRDTDVDILRLPPAHAARHRPDIPCRVCSRASDNHGVFATQPGEWLEYTVQVATQGVYDVEFSVVSVGGGGTFQLEARQVNLTGALEVPGLVGRPHTKAPTARAGMRRPVVGPDPWGSVVATNVVLGAGEQTLRLQMLENGTFGSVGVFDRMEFTLVEAPHRSSHTVASITGASRSLPTLQACNGLGDLFEDIPIAWIDPVDRFILVDRPASSCFFRLRADSPTRITRIEASENQLRIRYE